MIVQVISAFFAILAFSVVNNVPKKFLLYCGTKNVLMLGFMNQEAYDKTIATKKVT